MFSYSSCHISGAANVNLASMMKKRFMAGKIGLVDLISSADARELLKVHVGRETELLARAFSTAS